MAPAEHSITEELTLKILDQLEHFMENRIPVPIKDGQVVYPVSFDDVRQAFLPNDDIRRIDTVALYLQKLGLQLDITFELENDNPAFHVGAEIPDAGAVKIGTISGKDDTAIKNTIRKLKEEILRRDKVIFVRDERLYYKDHAIPTGNLYHAVISSIWENRTLGIVPYETINTYLENNGKGIVQAQDVNKRINNAIGEFFKRMKDKNMTPSGRKLFKAIPSTGIQFNNN